MYARVTTFHLPISKKQEAIDIYNNSVIPEAKKQNGFKSAYFFVNRNSGKFVSVTIWENMEAAIANQKSGYFQKQIDKFEDLHIVEPEFDGYDVAAIQYADWFNIFFI